MKRYVKYKDEDGEYWYQVTLPNGNKHLVKKEFGDYVHQLEQKLNQ